MKIFFSSDIIVGKEMDIIHYNNSNTIKKTKEIIFTRRKGKLIYLRKIFSYVIIIIFISFA